MSRRRRGRITVQSQPTGATRAVRRMAGVVQVIFGLVFVVVAVTQIMPLSPLFSLPFLAMGALAVVMGVLSAVGKNGLPHRVGYDVETGIEEGPAGAGPSPSASAVSRAWSDGDTPCRSIYFLY